MRFFRAGEHTAQPCWPAARFRSAEAGLRYVKRRDGRPAVTWEAIHQHQLGFRKEKEQDAESPNLNFLLSHGKKAQAQ